MNTNKLVRIAIFGAIGAVLIDHIAKPTLAKSIGL